MVTSCGGRLEEEVGPKQSGTRSKHGIRIGLMAREANVVEYVFGLNRTISNTRDTVQN